MALTPYEIEDIVISLVIVALVVRRLVGMTRGVPLTSFRPSIYPVLLLVAFLWGTAELESLLLIPRALPYLVAADLAILLGTGFLLTPFAERMTEVTLKPDGGGTVRISASLGTLFVVIYVLRLGLAITLFPASLQFGAPPGGAPPFSQQEILAGIDGLLSLSAGLLVARSNGLRRKVASSRAAARTGG